MLRTGLPLEAIDTMPPAAVWTLIDELRRQSEGQQPAPSRPQLAAGSDVLVGRSRGGPP